jgi:heptosyltransferase-2
MHVASALGTPVIVPFGSTSPEMTAPSLASSAGHEFITGEASCAPCFRRECPIDFRCMKSISVEQMIQASLRARGRTGH